MALCARIVLSFALVGCFGCSAISGLSGLDFDSGSGGATSQSTGSGRGGGGDGAAGPTSGAAGSGGGPSCTNKKKDGDETDVDCGGSCPPCDLGFACDAKHDCIAGDCIDGYCQTAPVGVWEQIMTIADPAADRYGCVMAWDGTTLRMLQGLHGSGQTSGAKSYLFDWPTVSWTQVATDPPTFEGRYRAMIGASAAGILIFGGETTTGTLDDAWTLAPGGTLWSQVSPPGPTARAWGAMAASTTETVLFGGTPDLVTPLDDTWEFGAGGWMELHPLPAPPARYGSSMAYDSAHGEAVLFGGTTTTSVLGDYWLWKGSIWQQGIASAPPARSSASMVFDSARLRTVLFTGVGADSAMPLTDTWEWDGSAWVPTASDTPARSESCAAYDPVQKRIVLYGGRTPAGSVYSDTWQYHAHGNACRAATDCDTSACVDHLCCEQASCGTCERCNDPNAPGVCTKCSDSECVSGQCP